MTEIDTAEIRDFRIDIPQADLDDLAERLARVRWADEYHEDFHAENKPTEPTTVPLGLANFAWDFQSIRPFAERDHKNIVSWNVYDTGSHFAAHDAPELLVDDIRGFFRRLG